MSTWPFSSIDRGLTVLDLHLSSTGVEANLVAIGQIVSGDLNRRQRQLRVDLLRPILVSHVGLVDRQRRDEIVERLVGCVRIGRGTRKVVATLLVDEIVDVDVFDSAGLHDVAAAQQLKQTEIDPRSSDRRERRSVGPCRGPEANVSQVDRCVQHVVAELVGAEFDLLAGEERDDLIDNVTACGRSMNGDQRNDDRARR